jgi:hypothetical protein
MDMIFILFGVPIAFVVGCYVGRQTQKLMWDMHLPYEDRVREIRKQKA